MGIALCCCKDDAVDKNEANRPLYDPRSPMYTRTPYMSQVNPVTGLPVGLHLRRVVGVKSVKEYEERGKSVSPNKSKQFFQYVHDDDEQSEGSQQRTG